VEEESVRNGVFGRYAHLYRRNAPVGRNRLEGPLRPRASDTRKAGLPGGADWTAARMPLLGNDDVRRSLAGVEAASPWLFRNADVDELLVVYLGAGRLETAFGALPYGPGDCLLRPRGVAYRLCPTSPSRLLVMETFSEISLPDEGMLGQHALFDPAVLEVPSPVEGSTLQPGPTGEYEVRIQRSGERSRAFYRHNPHDVVGWKGTLAPLRLNVRDIQPVVSNRCHLPPSAHTTFLMRNALVCSVLPRPLENGDPAALQVPFFHSHIDFDEVAPDT
jgi:homogentisate 1,2-dioxygenase